MVVKKVNIETDTWYGLTQLLAPADVMLEDGSIILKGRNRFGSAKLQALTGVTRVSEWPRPGVPTTYRYLQLSLLNVSREDVDGFPATIARRILREHVLCLSACRYAFDVLVSVNHQVFYSSGVVCACLQEFHPRPATDSEKKHREVDVAYRRGLLDSEGKVRADRRIEAKPVLQELEALKHADYLPDDASWIEVLFSHWYDLYTDELASTRLLDMDDLDRTRIQLKSRPRQKEFRVADLFQG